jgi:hypothetical protein
MRLLLFLLVGCGHTTKLGAGPLVDSHGKPGVEASVELGTHLIGAKEAAVPIGIRLEASTTTGGMQGIIGLAYGATLPPGGRRAPADDGSPRHGWGGRLSLLGAGLAMDQDGASLAMRGGLAVTRGSSQPGGLDGSGCTSGHEKSRICYGWRTWSYVHTGVELATGWTFVRGDDPDGSLRLRDWRVAAEVIYERGTLRDLDLH